MRKIWIENFYFLFLKIFIQKIFVITSILAKSREMASKNKMKRGQHSKFICTTITFCENIGRYHFMGWVHFAHFILPLFSATLFSFSSLVYGASVSQFYTLFLTENEIIIKMCIINISQFLRNNFHSKNHRKILKNLQNFGKFIEKNC